MNGLFNSSDSTNQRVLTIDNNNNATERKIDQETSNKLHDMMKRDNANNTVFISTDAAAKITDRALRIAFDRWTTEAEVLSHKSLSESYAEGTGNNEIVGPTTEVHRSNVSYDDSNKFPKNAFSSDSNSQSKPPLSHFGTPSCSSCQHNKPSQKQSQEGKRN